MVTIGGVRCGTLYLKDLSSVEITPIELTNENSCQISDVPEALNRRGGGTVDSSKGIISCGRHKECYRYSNS